MLSEQSAPSIHLAPLPVKGTSVPTSVKPRALAETRVLLAISVAQNAFDLNVTNWMNWLNTDRTPAEIMKIDARIESAYESHSSLILLSLPTLIWSRMADREAYNFIGFIRSENLFQKPRMQEPNATKEEQSRPQARPLLQSSSYRGASSRFPIAIPTKSLPTKSPARGSRDSGFEDGPYDSEAAKALENKEYREEIQAVQEYFKVLSEGEQPAALISLLEYCTHELQAFIKHSL
ncbi:MAG: hypothetical protein Q9191_007189 [Dirinaria sp. TL-2023a]